MVAKLQKIEKPPKINEEILELEKKLAEKKQELVEEKEAGKHEKEIIREIIKEKVEEAAVTPAPTSQAQTIKKIKEIAGEPKERQVQLLVNLALEKGIVQAVEVARGLNNPYLLDELHDVLVDEYYSKLVERGKLKRI
jgi:Fic family protein